MASTTTSGIGLASANTYSNRPFIKRVTNDQLEKIEKERQESQQSALELQNSPIITSLAGHIRNAFTAAQTAKQTVMERMLKCLRAREGKYDGETAELIRKSGGTNIYMMLTDAKCRALEGWLNEIMLPPGDKPFSIEPTPIPEIPPNIINTFERMFQEDYIQRSLQEAAAAGVPPENVTIDEEHYQQERKQEEKKLVDLLVEQAEKDAADLERHVHDDLFEGGWFNSIHDILYDFATYPTAFMEGPIYRRKPKLQWTPVEGVQKQELRIVTKVVREYDRVSPLDVYPSPGSRTIQDGDLCIRYSYSRRGLEKFKGTPGFNSKMIEHVLSEYPTGYQEFIYHDSEIQTLQDREYHQHDPEGRFDVIKFHGSVPGHKLLMWGMSEKQITDSNREYPVCCHMLGSYVIGAKLNPHPLGKRNIYAASFEKKNDSVWGKSPPELMEDIQRICNALARAICNNAAIASGPQVYQYQDMIPAGQNSTEIVPWKIWSFSAEKMKKIGGVGTTKPMEFYQPPLIAAELQILYDYFFKMGSEVTGIPAYMYGNPKVGGAGDTASGLSMLMNAAAKGLRNAAKNMDQGIIIPSVEEDWLQIMLTRPELAKGDVKIKARASDYLVQKEVIQMRKKEFADSTRNPIDMQIIGPGGRAELLRDLAKSLNMNPDKIVPPREKMLQTMVDQQMQAVIGKLAQGLGVAPEQLIAILQSPDTNRAGQPGGGQSQEQNPAGSPMAGQEARQINQ